MKKIVVYGGEVRSASKKTKRASDQRKISTLTVDELRAVLKTC